MRCSSGFQALLLAALAVVPACSPAPMQPAPPVQPVQVMQVSAVAPTAPPTTAPPASPIEPREIVSEYVALLGKRVSDPLVVRYLEPRSGQYETSTYGASVYFSFKKEGVSFLFEDEVLGTVFLYSEGHEHFSQFQGRLPRGLSFSDHLEQVRERMGKPSRSGGGGGQTTILGPVADWDKWYFPTWSLHVQYDRDGRVQMVTLMSQERDPHRGQSDEER